MANGNIVLRAQRKHFMGIGEGAAPKYQLISNCTDLSTSKNTTTYETKYVEDAHNTTYTTGMSTSIAYSFDLHEPDEVNADLAAISDNEVIGDDAVREIIEVDFFKPVESGGYEARKRRFTVVPDASGSGTDALVYSGSLSAEGDIIPGVAQIETPTDGNWKNVRTITFTESTATPTSFGGYKNSYNDEDE